MPHISSTKKNYPLPPQGCNVTAIATDQTRARNYVSKSVDAIKCTNTSPKSIIVVQQKATKFVWTKIYGTKNNVVFFVGFFQYLFFQKYFVKTCKVRTLNKIKWCRLSSIQKGLIFQIRSEMVLKPSHNNF